MTREQIALWTYAFVISVGSYLAPIAPLMITVGALLFVDTFFGIWAARKRNERLTSNGASRMVAKMCVYQIVIITLFACENHIMGTWIPAVKLAGSMIAVVEVISILENAGIIVGKPVFKFLIQKLSSKSNKFGEK